MTLAPKIKQALKAKAHALKPIVMIGMHGLTDAVTQEMERALNDHELVKVRISSNDREVKKNIYVSICEACTAEPVQLIGNIGVFYRKRAE